MMAPNGRVQAMVGSVDWSQRQFNNAVKARVQAGSTAKLPLLIAACEAGKTPESRVLDQPVTGNWPSNGELGYRGQTTLKEAIASSRNAAAVRLAQEIGADTVAEVSRRIGIDPGLTDDPSFVLGSYSSNVMTMTAAYTAVANGGYRVDPSGVLAVVDGRGQVRADFLTPMRKRVIPEKCVEPTQAVLREVVQNGTGRAARLRALGSLRQDRDLHRQCRCLVYRLERAAGVWSLDGPAPRRDRARSCWRGCTGCLLRACCHCGE